MPIAKIVKGTTALGCLSYVLGKPGSVLHQTNCVGSTPVEFAAQFDLALQAQAQRQSRGRKASTNVYHTSIAFDLECRLTVREKLEIAGRYLEGMGFDRGQNAFVIAEHHDTQHQHLHLIVSRVRWDGYTTPCWQDYQKAEAIMRQVESDYGLKPVASSREAEVKAPTVAEVRKSRSTGKPIPRIVIQQAVDDCLERGARTLVQLQQALQEQHEIVLTSRPIETQSGRMTLALLFELEGRVYSASKLGKKYRYSRLKQQFEDTGVIEQTESEGQLVKQTAEQNYPPGWVSSGTGVETDGETAAEMSGRIVSKGADMEAAAPDPLEQPIVSDLAREDESWQHWLAVQTEQDWANDIEAVSDHIQRDWALWTQLSRATHEWLLRKGVTPAGESQNSRRLAEVALYCRLSGYHPEQVARALMISPHCSQLQDSKLQVLDWQQRDKEQFSVLKLMVKVDQQVMEMQRQWRQIRQEEIRRDITN